MTSRRRSLKDVQTRFLDACLTTNQPLNEVLDEANVAAETRADWLATRAFRKRVGGLVRQLRRTRELQIQIASRVAAQMLTDITAGTAPSATPTVRAACVDVIRFARDPRGRAAATATVVDGLTTPATLFHPDLAPEDAETLARELSRDAQETEARG